jgi:ribose transport system permease protein
MTLQKILSDKPWIWSFAATIIVWITTVLFTGGASSFGLSQAALTFAAFSVIVGISQMFVITLGPGNIDLSVPATMTLSGTLALKLMDVAGRHDPTRPPSFDRHRPDHRARQLHPHQAPAHSADYCHAVDEFYRPVGGDLEQSRAAHQAAGNACRFATSGLFGLPNIALVALVLSAIAWVLLEKSISGRWISAIGQSRFAARMAGIPVDGTQLVTYMLCAVLASVCGYLLASFSGGAALNMGSEYLLMSIAVVVIGGTAVAGGNSNIPGIWGASLFMFLVVSMLNTYGFGAGFRLILTGFIIIAVILLAGGKKSHR